MVKEPRPGRVKTRLARDIGTIAAARWFRGHALDLVARLQDPRWRLVLAVAPDRAGLASRVWPAHLPRIAQGRGDLGARMARVFRTLPPGPALIVGADIAGLTPAHVARAFAALGPAPAVLGPATDGGYWALGLRRTACPPARLLEGVRWSTPHALADTAATLPARTARADRLSDVDTAGDLARARASLCCKYPRRRLRRRPRRPARR